MRISARAQKTSPASTRCAPPGCTCQSCAPGQVLHSSVPATATSYADHHELSARCWRHSTDTNLCQCCIYRQDEDWLFETFGDDPVLHYILAAQGGLSEEEMEDFERKSRNNVNFGGAVLPCSGSGFG